MTGTWINTSTGEAFTVTAELNISCQRCGLQAKDDRERFREWAANGWLWRCPECARLPS
jgi:hypothetical protein